MAGTFTITKATPVAVATGGTFTYDGASHGGTCTVTGANSAVLTGTLTYTPGPAMPVNAGTYTATCSYAGDANYTAVSTTATITIAKKNVTVTAGGGTKIYGAADPVFTTTQTGFTSSDAAGITFATTRAAGTSVGAYVTTATATGGNIANYNVTFVTGTFTITKATLTVTADNKTKTQGATNPALTYQVSGFVNGDTIAAVTGAAALATTATTTSAAGTYPITVATGTLAATNYQFTFVNGTLTVTVAGSPVLNLVKSVSKTSAIAGDQLVYTLNYSNSGNATATSVVLADAVPASTTFVSATAGGALTSGAVRWTVASLAAGASGSVTFTVRINPTTHVCVTSGHSDGDNDDHDRRRNGHYDGDRCGHDGGTNCVSAITNKASVVSSQTPAAKFSNTVTTALVSVVNADADAYTTRKNYQLNKSAPGVLLNDDGAGTLVVSKVNGQSVSSSGRTVSTAQGGTVKMYPNGSFVYTPRSNWSGTDTFTYTVTNGSQTDTATVTIAVSSHYDGDNCDHDRHRNGHSDGDDCDHDHATGHDDHRDGDRCDHDLRRRGHHSGDGCEHERRRG